jgi:predicted NAD/FAD-dependent oxidoreductase
MMFYRSSETSAGAFLALLQMKADPSFDFSIIHCAEEMQELPNAIARRLPVRASSPVLALEPCRQGWSVTTAAQGRETYRRLVLATTAGPALKMLRSGPDPHRTLLAGTRYSSTINLAFRLPCGTLGGTHCFYVPFVENQVVAEFTNESLKGRNAIAAGWSLVNVGLHESASRALSQAGDEEIFEVVAAELRKLHPGLEQAEPYDLVRWAEAIPKYSCQQVTAVKRFLREGQGAQGLYLCGDYMNSPWLEGASRSGRRVARQILEAE